MKTKRKVIILDDMNFAYTATEIAKFRIYWEEYSKHTENTTQIVNQIANDLGLEADEVLLLAVDQKRKGKI